MEDEADQVARAASWLPPEWPPPGRVELPTGHHLRPVRSSDVDLHLRAVLASQERLWALYGAKYRWPPQTLSARQLVNGPIEQALDSFVPAWIAGDWPLLRPRYSRTRGSLTAVELGRPRRTSST